MRAKNNFSGRKTGLAGERNVFVDVRDLVDLDSGGVVTGLGNANAADEMTVFKKRHAAGSSGKSTGDGHGHGHDGISGRGTERDDAAGAFNFIDVGESEVGEIDADERAVGLVEDARREMLLHNVAGGAGSEGMLVAAQKRGGSGFGDGVGEHIGGGNCAIDAPDAKDPAFAVNHSNNGIAGDVGCTCYRLGYNGLRIGQGQLGGKPEGEQPDGQNRWQQAYFHRGQFVAERGWRQAQNGYMNCWV